MSYGCGKKEYGRVCGRMFAGYMHLCADCKDKYTARYPQGWRYYPGDCCEHGVYIGGIGADYMCGRCELGD